jgi:hypothetical protein
MREIRKKPEGWRNLRVGELALWWMVGKPRVTAKLGGLTTGATVQAIEVALVVERTDGSGKKLRAMVRGQRALCVPAAGFNDVQTFSIEPSAVRELVERVAPRGAWPTGTGTITAELTLPDKPLPADLEFRLEHLDGLTLIVRK